MNNPNSTRVAEFRPSCEAIVSKYFWFFLTLSLSVILESCTTTTQFANNSSAPPCLLEDDKTSGFCKERSYSEKDTKKLLIFIHGVTGSAKKTWGEWPNEAYDDDHFKSFDIYLVNYGTTWFTSAPNIHEVASYELMRLQDQQAFQKYEDIHFVTHSMGGLVAKSMILRFEAEARDPRDVDRIKSLTLLGTPSQGAELVKWWNPFTWNRQASDLQPAHMNSFLQQLEDQWVQSLLRRDGRRGRFPKTFCAYEALPLYELDLVVPRQMANTRCDSTLHPMPFNHRSLVEFTKKDHDPYQWTMARILEADSLANKERKVADHLRLGNVALIEENDIAALRHYVEAESLAVEIDDFRGLTEATLGFGVLAHYRQDLSKAMDLYKEAGTRFIKLGDLVGQARVFRHIGDLELDAGNSREARSAYIRADGILTHPQDFAKAGVIEKAWVSLSLGHLECREGHPRDAWLKVKEAKSLFQGLGHVRGLANTYLANGRLEMLHGRMDAAKAAFLEARAGFGDAKDKRGLIRALLGLGRVFHFMGNLDESRSLFLETEQIIAEVNVTDDPRKTMTDPLTGMLSLNLARLEMEQANRMEARRHLEHARTSFNRSIDAQGEVEVLLEAANLQYLEGNSTLALGILTEVRDKYRQLRDRNGESDVLLLIGKISLDSLEIDQAMAHYESAYGLCTPSDNRRCQANALLGKGQAEYIKSNYASAKQFIVQAQHIFESVNDNVGLINATLARGRIEQFSVETYQSSNAEALQRSHSLYMRAMMLAEKHNVTNLRIEALLHLALLLPDSKEAISYVKNAETLLLGPAGDLPLQLVGRLRHVKGHLTLHYKISWSGKSNRGAKDDSQFSVNSIYHSSCYEAVNILLQAVDASSTTNSDGLLLGGIYKDLGYAYQCLSKKVAGQIKAAQPMPNQEPNNELFTLMKSYVEKARKSYLHLLKVCPPQKCPEEAEEAYIGLMQVEVYSPVPGDPQLASTYAFRAAVEGEANQRGNSDFYFRLGLCLGQVTPSKDVIELNSEAQRCTNKARAPVNDLSNTKVSLER